MREAVPDANVHATHQRTHQPAQQRLKQQTQQVVIAGLASRLPSAQSTQSSYQETEPCKRVRRSGFLGKGACPRALVAKRVYVRIREKEGFTHPALWRAPCFWGTYEWDLHAVDT